MILTFQACVGTLIEGKSQTMEGLIVSSLVLKFIYYSYDGTKQVYHGCITMMFLVIMWPPLGSLSTPIRPPAIGVKWNKPDFSCPYLFA